MATTAAWKRPRKAASRIVRPTTSEPAGQGNKAGRH